jgi:hypothetical protein
VGISDIHWKGEKNMKKKSFIVLVSLALVICWVSVSQTQGPALVIQDSGCFLPAADGSAFFTQESHIVYSNDANGNSKITCKGMQPESVPLPNKAVHWDADSTGGKLCFTSFGLTDNWSAVVTPRGVSHLICHINPSD